MERRDAHEACRPDSIDASTNNVSRNARSVLSRVFDVDAVGVGVYNARPLAKAP